MLMLQHVMWQSCAWCGSWMVMKVSGVSHRLCCMCLTGVWVQGTSDPPQPCLISTATADPFWRVVRKGVAPAFNSTNIRCAAECCSRVPAA